MSDTNAGTPTGTGSDESTDAATWLHAPTLRGRRVVLERLGSHHSAGLLHAADDDRVFTHLRVARPVTPADAAALVRAAHEGRASGASVTWAQMVGGEVAGLTTYYDLNAATRSLAIGSTWLARRWQRTGVNREAKLLLLTRAFDELHCVRVVWHADERNDASRQALLRLGATQEGLLRKHKIRRDGTWRTTVQFAMTDDDWPTIRRRLITQVRSERVDVPAALGPRQGAAHG